MAKKRLAIVGNGMAASRLLDDLVRRDALRRYAITVFGEEVGGCYNRILLSKVLAGAEPDAITIKPAAWYEANGVGLVRSRVTRLDTAARLAHAADDQRHPYDIAVLATGSAPFVPKIDNLNAPDGRPKAGVFIYRTLDDVIQIRSAARAGDNAVVLGGGLLGLEVAKALSDLGLHVTVVHLLDTLMNQQLDRPAAEMLRRQIERCGIFVRTGRTTRAVVGEGAVEGVVLDDGTALPADLLVLACGVRPRVDLAKESGLPVRAGVLVNDTLATAVPGVYAVGECAEHAGKTYGLVAPVWEQASVLADVLSGANPQARYRGSRLYTRLKVAGVEVASIGACEPETPADQVVQVIEERRATYRKLILRDGRLVGAVLVGDTAAAANLAQRFDRDEPLPDDPLLALCSPEAATATACGAGPDPERTVCNCNQVTEGCIRQAIDAGATTLSAVAQATRAGTGCGSCRGQVARLLGTAALASGRARGD